MADQIRQQIQSGVGADFFAITSDGWSKPTQSPQLQSVTIHWVDRKFCRCDAVLGAFPMEEFFHTGEIIAEKIAECLEKNGLSLNKMACCVRDDARNMQSAIRQMDKDSFQCCCHFLNLVVFDALKSECLSEIIYKAREWTKECRKSKIKKSVSLPSAISGTSQSTQTSRIQLQLATYKVLGRTQIDCDIFNWWNDVGVQFPDLFLLARIAHSISATSVSSERLFSKAGMIYGNKLRNRLSGDMAEQILLIKGNLGHLNLAPSTEPDEDDEELLNFDELEIIED